MLQPASSLVCLVSSARMSGKGRPGRPWTPLMSGTMLCRKKKNKEKIGKIKETKKVVNQNGKIKEKNCQK